MSSPLANAFAGMKEARQETPSQEQPAGGKKGRAIYTRPAEANCRARNSRSHNRQKQQPGL